MGLDMYGLVSCDGRKPIRFFRWRKHWALHTAMEQLYRERGGTEEFNGIMLPLSLEDIDRLEGDTSRYGDGRGESWLIRVQDMEFFDMARESIAEGYSVFYDSSW